MASCVLHILFCVCLLVEGYAYLQDGVTEFYDDDGSPVHMIVSGSVLVTDEPVRRIATRSEIPHAPLDINDIKFISNADDDDDEVSYFFPTIKKHKSHKKNKRRKRHKLHRKPYKPKLHRRRVEKTVPGRLRDEIPEKHHKKKHVKKTLYPPPSKLWSVHKVLSDTEESLRKSGKLGVTEIVEHIENLPSFSMYHDVTDFHHEPTYHDVTDFEPIETLSFKEKLSRFHHLRNLHQTHRNSLLTTRNLNQEEMQGEIENAAMFNKKMNRGPLQSQENAKEYHEKIDELKAHLNGLKNGADDNKVTETHIVQGGTHTVNGQVQPRPIDNNQSPNNAPISNDAQNEGKNRDQLPLIERKILQSMLSSEHSNRKMDEKEFQETFSEKVLKLLNEGSDSSSSSSQEDKPENGEHSQIHKVTDANNNELLHAETERIGLKLPAKMLVNQTKPYELSNDLKQVGGNSKIDSKNAEKDVENPAGFPQKQHPVLDSIAGATSRHHSDEPEYHLSPVPSNEPKKKLSEPEQITLALKKLSGEKSFKQLLTEHIQQQLTKMNPTKAESKAKHIAEEATAVHPPKNHHKDPPVVYPTPSFTEFIKPKHHHKEDESAEQTDQSSENKKSQDELDHPTKYKAAFASSKKPSQLYKEEASDTDDKLDSKTEKQVTAHQDPDKNQVTISAMINDDTNYRNSKHAKNKNNGGLEKERLEQMRLFHVALNNSVKQHRPSMFLENSPSDEQDKPNNAPQSVPYAPQSATAFAEQASTPDIAAAEQTSQSELVSNAQSQQTAQDVTQPGQETTQAEQSEQAQDQGLTAQPGNTAPSAQENRQRQTAPQEAASQSSSEQTVQNEQEQPSQPIQENAAAQPASMEQPDQSDESKMEAQNGAPSAPQAFSSPSTNQMKVEEIEKALRPGEVAEITQPLPAVSNQDAVNNVPSQQPVAATDAATSDTKEIQLPDMIIPMTKANTNDPETEATNPVSSANTTSSVSQNTTPPSTNENQVTENDGTAAAAAAENSSSTPIENQILNANDGGATPEVSASAPASAPALDTPASPALSSPAIPVSSLISPPASAPSTSLTSAPSPAKVPFASLEAQNDSPKAVLQPVQSFSTNNQAPADVGATSGWPAGVNPGALFSYQMKSVDSTSHENGMSRENIHSVKSRLSVKKGASQQLPFYASKKWNRRQPRLKPGSVMSLLKPHRPTGPSIAYEQLQPAYLRGVYTKSSSKSHSKASAKASSESSSASSSNSIAGNGMKAKTQTGAITRHHEKKPATSSGYGSGSGWGYGKTSYGYGGGGGWAGSPPPAGMPVGYPQNPPPDLPNFGDANNAAAPRPPNPGQAGASHTPPGHKPPISSQNHQSSVAVGPNSVPPSYSKLKKPQPIKNKANKLNEKFNQNSRKPQNKLAKATNFKIVKQKSMEKTQNPYRYGAYEKAVSQSRLTPVPANSMKRPKQVKKVKPYNQYPDD